MFLIIHWVPTNRTAGLRLKPLQQTLFVEGMSAVMKQSEVFFLLLAPILQTNRAHEGIRHTRRRLDEFSDRG